MAAPAGLGRRMGVPEVVFISGLSHYLFTELSQLHGRLPLLGQMMTRSASSCVGLLCFATCANGAKSVLEFLSSPLRGTQTLSSGLVLV